MVKTPLCVIAALDKFYITEWLINAIGYNYASCLDYNNVK
jgi:hypothetical protein